MEARDHAAPTLEHDRELFDRMALSAELSARAMAQPRDEMGRFTKASGDSAENLDRFNSGLRHLRVNLHGANVDLSRFRGGLSAVNDQFGAMNAKAGQASGALRLFSLITTGLAAGSGPLAGLMALGIPAVFGGIGLAAHMMGNSIAQAQAQGRQLTTMQRAALPVVQMLNKAYGQLNPVLHQSGIYLLGVVKSLGPSIQQAVTALGPMITVLAHGLGGFLQGFIRPLAQAMHSMMPVVQAFANGFAGFGAALGKMLSQINFQAAAQGLSLLFKGINAILPAFTQLLNALMPIGNLILSVAVPAMSQLLHALMPVAMVLLHTLGPAFVQLVTTVAGAFIPVLQQLAPYIAPVAHWIAVLVQTFGQMLAAMAPLLPPLMQVLAAFSQLDAPIEAIASLFVTLANALKPIIALFAQIIGYVTGWLDQAFTEFANAVQPLIPLIGQVVQLFGGLFLSALQAILPALLPLIPPLMQLAQVLFSTLAKVLVELSPVITQIAKIVTTFLVQGLIELMRVIQPLLPVLGRVALMLGRMLLQALRAILPALLPLIPPLGQLASAVLQLLLQVLTALQPLWGQLIKAFVQLLPALIQLVPPLTQLIIALTPLIVLVAKLAADIAGPLLGALAHTIVLLVKLAALIIGGVAKAITWLVRNVPRIPEVFVKAWHAVTRAVGDALSTIDRALTSWGRDIVNFFRGAGSWLVNAGRDILGGMVHGFSDAWHTVTKWLRHIGDTITGWFGSAGTWLYNVGIDLIGGLWQGITSTLTWLWNKLKDFAGSVVHHIMHFFHIGSPSKLMADLVGLPLVQGIAKGIGDNKHLVHQAMQALQPALTSTLNVGGGLVAPRPASPAAGGIHIDLRGAQVMSDRDVDQLVNKIGRAVSTRILPQAGVFATGGPL